MIIQVLQSSIAWDGIGRLKVFGNGGNGWAVLMVELRLRIDDNSVSSRSLGRRIWQTCKLGSNVKFRETVTYSSVKLIWQPTMTTTELHSNDNQLAHDAELAGEGGVETGVSQTESNSTICGNNLEKYRKHREGLQN